MLALIGAALAGPTVLGWELNTQLTDAACKESSLAYLRAEHDWAQAHAADLEFTASAQDRADWQTYLQAINDEYNRVRAADLPDTRGRFDACGPPTAYTVLDPDIQFYGVARDERGFILAVIAATNPRSVMETDRLAAAVRADVNATLGAPALQTVDETQWVVADNVVILSTQVSGDQASLSVLWASALDRSTPEYRASVWGDPPLGWTAEQAAASVACAQNSPPLDAAEWATLHKRYRSELTRWESGPATPAKDQALAKARHALQAPAACTPPRYHPDLVQHWVTHDDGQVVLHGRLDPDDAPAADRVRQELTDAYGAPVGTHEGLTLWTSPVGGVWLDTSATPATFGVEYD